MVALERIGQCQHGQNFFTHAVGFPGQVVGMLAELFQHHHELVAPQAGHGVHVAHAFVQAHGHLLQQQVALVVAQGVVQGLEVIEVDEQQRTALLAPLGAGQRLGHAVHQQHAVGQTGERVVKRQALDLALGGLALADVGVDGQHRMVLTQIVFHQRPAPFHMDGAAVAVPLHDFAVPLAMLQGGLGGAAKLRGVVVQQGLDRLAQHLHLRPAIKPLCALVPVDDAVLQIAHDDGVLGLVEQ